MPGIAKTARWAAAVRAIETSRPDALFKDPWADALAGEEGTRWAASRTPESLVPMIVRNGFDPSAPATWLAEGLLFYLSNETIRTLLVRVSALASKGSSLGFDIPNRAVLSHPATQAWVKMQADALAPWTGTMEDPSSYLADVGWRANVTQCGNIDADYGRWAYPVSPMGALGLPHHWFVTAKKAT